ncbi:ADP-ribose pyrophosphatase YjhB, NUDIX family [Segatella bryantii]|nr:NUDIX domain-containing protein [Segatella bryantii]UKK74764.1 NUDIX domain-containing protein [Segatella bryantii]SEA10186.1 ADP-ribose pyrophosphatase YjhB, NUDIX family [Segatella bryantii]
MEHISAGLLVIRDNKILLVQQKNDHDKLHLSIPKGLIEKDEDPLDAAIRETYEETGLKVYRRNIIKTPYLMNIDSSYIKRRIIYYVAHIHSNVDVSPIDKAEIEWAGFVSYGYAEKHLQPTQLSILILLNPLKLSKRAMNWLCNCGYIECDWHPERRIKIFNYTKKCKTEQYWDEITLWSRGLIADDRNNILYRPLKKFFELDQLYQFFTPHEDNGFKLFEKKDGALGIMYWIEDQPYIATRGSFSTSQAIIGTRLLYTKHYEDFCHFNRNYTYLFEIISPKDKHIIDYGDIEELYLIGAYDNKRMRDISSDEIHNLETFKKVEYYSEHGTIEALSSEDQPNREGYVALFPDGNRLKIKFKTYKENYVLHYKK